MTKRGLLIVVEGIDGSGKSSVVRHLAQYLQDHYYAVVATKEPGGTPFGQKIRHLVQYPEEPIVPLAEFLLFAADRAQHIARVVRPALERGDIVISDRMHDSSLAYQGYGNGLDMHTIDAIGAVTMDAIKQDLTIYLRIDPEIAYARIHERGGKLTQFEARAIPFLTRVANGFEEIYAYRDNVVTVDASLPFDDVIRQIIEKVGPWIAVQIR